jgi:CubicO group peptidase (beta-lactamase class C family)
MLARSVILPLTFTCLVGLPSRQAAACQQDVDVARVERVALAELKDTRTPGAAVALIRDGRVVWAGGLGVSSAETGTPVTPDMLFRLGSTTKMLTAAMLVGLVEEGKLGLEVPIGRYVPGLAPRLAGRRAVRPGREALPAPGRRDAAGDRPRRQASRDHPCRPDAPGRSLGCSRFGRPGSLSLPRDSCPRAPAVMSRGRRGLS